jgi:DNA polymerase elongation subunit (family B)
MKVIQADHNLNSYKLDNVASTFMRGKITKYVKNDNSTTIFTNNLGNLINNNYITIATQIDMYLEGKKFKINNITKLEKGGSFEIDYVINDDLVSISWTEAKDDVSPQEIFNFYKSGDPDKIKDVAIYCIQDCELCIRLINKLSIVSNKIGMANVCSVPLSYLFLRGQGVKIFSLIAKQCMNEHFVVPVIEKSDDNSGYEGAIVLIAKHGIYLDNPIAVVDYSSLYPSSMISENLSHDSIVWIYTESNGISTYTPENWEKYDNLDGYEYETIEYDLFETGSDGEKIKTGLQRCRYVQPLKNDDGEYINESRAIMPRILQKLLKARKDTRKKIPSEPDPFKKDVLNGLQLAYKVTCNSLYGQLGARTSPVFFKEIAASTTATGRKLLKFAKDQVESKFQGEFEVNGEKVGVVTDVVYGDSVLGDTPLILRDKKTHFVTIKTIDSLNNNWIPYENFKPLDTNISNKQQTTSDFEIWVENKWVDIKRVIRHKTNKSIYRVLTHVGVVDVTEDHSLIHENYSEIKPNELIVNKTPLLHGFPYNDISNYIFDEQFILFIQKNFSSYIKTTNKLTAQKIYIFLLQYYQFVYIDCNHDEYCIFVSTSKLNNINIVKKIIKLDNVDDKTYVYDIETSSGKFNGGVGQLVLKNTDSTFNRFRVYKNGKEILKKDALPYCIKLGQMAGQHVTKQLKHPHDLEYEKTFYPFILFSKKRYVGELYELDPNKISYRNSMGIVLKRRDNAPVLKKIYGDIIDTIMTKQDLKLSEHIIKDEVEKLLNGEYPLSNFIISKTLKSNYKNPQSIAHVVLADRITQRDPGNAPQSNDRIPYIYIKIDDSKIKKQKIMKIGDLITEYRNIIKNLTDLEKKYKYVDILLDKINNVSLMGNKNEPEKDNNTYFIIRDLLRTAVEKSHSSNKLLQSFQSLIFEICKKKVKIVQGDRIESPEYIKQNSNIEIDYNFYLTNQVLKPVSQIFALEIEQLDGFSPSNFKENKRQEYTADLLFKKMIDKYKRKNINTLDNYFFIKS